MGEAALALPYARGAGHKRHPLGIPLAKRTHTVYVAVKAATITPCFNQQTWGELQRTIGYDKLQQQLTRIAIEPDAILQLIASQSYFTITKRRLNIIPDDPSDNHILACAISARALCIVSGDGHLLRLKKFRGIPIITPGDFIKQLGSISPP